MALLRILVQDLCPVCVCVCVYMCRTGRAGYGGWAWGQIKLRGWGDKRPVTQESMSTSVHHYRPGLIIIFYASVSTNEVMPLSNVLYRLLPFPPLHHLWYTNGKAQSFVGWKGFQAHSVGHQSHFLYSGSACTKTGSSFQGPFSYLFCECGSGGGLVTQSCLTLVTPWTVAHQGPLSFGFSRQEYWSA